MTTPAVGSRRWSALVFIALAQLMVALDATIVNIALPSAQADLGISDADRQWVVTAYTLAFGGLLLLGGRVADLAGRYNVFLVGLVGFAVASALGGAAGSLWMLVAARALQGAFAAVLAPTALSLLAVTFTDARERARAFSVYGAIAGSGAAVGLILGGLLAQNLSWRWCLYVNVPIAVVAVVGAALLLTPSPPIRASLDVVGALLATGGLVALVYACTLVVGRGVASPAVLGWGLAGLVLLGLFVWRQARASSPLLPLHILRDRSRAGAYLAVALTVAGMFGVFLFLTYYFQVVLHYSPVVAGLAFLPMSAAVMLSATLIAGRLLPKVPPRLLMAPGLLVAAGAMAWLTQLGPGSGYASLVLPAEILLGLGMGVVFTPAFSLATQHVSPRDAGVASAVVNAANQVGGSLGLALLNTVAADATASHPGPNSLVYGFAVASGWGATLLAAAALIATLMISEPPPAPHPQPPTRSTPDSPTTPTPPAHPQPVRVRARLRPRPRDHPQPQARSAPSPPTAPAPLRP
ncbi:MFS transporter [Nonomuraea sp. NPDC050556]|uniref:MFS transporter n=1 Tax=Nonomuraea sp. NPDC050556 TaxID=3364369 RepID=UPI0037B4C09F